VGKKRKQGGVEKAQKGGNLRATVAIAAQLPLVPKRASGAVSGSDRAGRVGSADDRAVKAYGWGGRAGSGKGWRAGKGIGRRKVVGWRSGSVP